MEEVKRPHQKRCWRNASSVLHAYWWSKLQLHLYVVCLKRTRHILVIRDSFNFLHMIAVFFHCVKRCLLYINSLNFILYLFNFHIVFLWFFPITFFLYSIFICFQIICTIRFRISSKFDIDCSCDVYYFFCLSFHKKNTKKWLWLMASVFLSNYMITLQASRLLIFDNRIWLHGEVFIKYKELNIYWF